MSKKFRPIILAGGVGKRLWPHSTESNPKHFIPIFKDVFDDDELIINETTKAEDIDEWDSLAHIRLVISIEKVFELRFTTDEISNLANVGDMAKLIMKKQTSG